MKSCSYLHSASAGTHWKHINHSVMQKKPCLWLAYRTIKPSSKHNRSWKMPKGRNVPRQGSSNASSPGARRVQKHTFPKRLLCCGSSQGQADSHQCGSPECQDGEANWHFSCFIIRGVDKKSKKTLEEECEIAGFGVGLCGKRQLRQNRADKQMGCESSEG